MKQLVTNRLRKALASLHTEKSQRTLEYLGTTPAEIWAHLQRQPSYEPWMTLQNIGQHRVEHGVAGADIWNIDHIIPVTAAGSGEGGAITEDDIRIRLHYTNLQPLRAIENLQKGAKV